MPWHEKLLLLIDIAAVVFCGFFWLVDYLEKGMD